MSDTFDILRQRTRTIRANRDQVEWSEISLQMHGGPPNSTRSYGVARVDNLLFRNLGCGDSTSFRVEPGQHTVVVHLGRWMRLPGYPESPRLSIQVEVPPGERVNLVCGLRPGAKEEWRAIRMARMRLFLISSLGSLLALLLGWFVFVLLGRLLAPAMIVIQIRGVWIPAPIIRVTLLLIVMAPIFARWCVWGNRLILAPNKIVLRSLQHRFVYPYILKTAEEPLHAGLTALRVE